GLGPVVAGGWLLATAMGAVTGAGIGATAGGLVGSLTSAGVPEHDAHVYAEGVRRGGALVTVRIDDAHAHTAADILQNCGGIDIEDRRQTYQSEGWSRFEHDAITDGKEKDEAPPVVPPLI
ncbi:MAG: hypothetical protein KJ827_12720, partial [Alphaproteobacteria bacterium]|nr:hypothetical protein [Alphaproteobacteria bacterium]